MSNPTENFKIKLNQNLWGLVVSFIALGAAEYFELCTLYWFAVSVAGVMTTSIVVTTFQYTKNYFLYDKNNWTHKPKEHSK